LQRVAQGRNHEWTRSNGQETDQNLTDNGGNRKSETRWGDDQKPNA